MSYSDRHGPAASAELDVITLLDTLLTNARRIVLIVFVVGLAGIGWSFLWPPKYQADILIQVEDGTGAGLAGNLPSQMSTFFDVKSSAAAEAQIITSRLVVSRAVDRQHLHIEAAPERFPLIGDFVSRFQDGPLAPGVFGFGGYAWGRERADVSRFDVPEPWQDEPFTLKVEAGGRYTLAGALLDVPLHGRVGAESRVNTSSGPLIITVTSLDARPGTAFSVIRHGFDDTVVKLQQRLDVQEKVRQSGVIVATLLGRDAERTSRTLREIGEQYVRQNVERKYADAAQSLGFLMAQLPELKRQLDDAQARYTRMRDERGVIDVPTQIATGLQQQAEARAQLIVLQQKRAELATRYAPQHPGVVAADRQIALLRAQITAFDSALGRLPDIEQSAARLMLDVKVSTDLYTSTLANAQQLQLVKAGRVGSVRMIDAPIVAQDPAWPKRPLVAAASLLGGLLVGLAYAFVREFLAGAVHSADEIERGTGLPVLATVPFSAAQRLLRTALADPEATRAALLAVEAPHDRAIESLRSLRTALRMTGPDAPGKVVVFTGAAPNAGKSFIALNLAAVLAATGLRVLLIDGDLRRPSLNVCLGVTRGPGWSDLIAGSASPERVIHRIESPRLDFVAAGTPADRPAELLLSARAGELIDALRGAYDFVLVDTPPVLAVEDAASFTSQASAVLLVARAGETRLGELNETVKRLGHGGTKPAGLILNGLSMRSVRASLGRTGYRSYDYGEPAKAQWRTALSLLRSRMKRT